jgi:hypothetical protein
MKKFLLLCGWCLLGCWMFDAPIWLFLFVAVPFSAFWVMLFGIAHVADELVGGIAKTCKDA